MPTFAFLNAPAPLTGHLLRYLRMLPYPTNITAVWHNFGSMLDTRLLSTPNRSTSELLRTL